MAEPEGRLTRAAELFLRDRARALREELASPWRRGERTPEAEAGRWFGLGLTLGVLLVGVGLGLFAAFREE